MSPPVSTYAASAMESQTTVPPVTVIPATSTGQSAGYTAPQVQLVQDPTADLQTATATVLDINTYFTAAMSFQALGTVSGPTFFISDFPTINSQLAVSDIYGNTSSIVVTSTGKTASQLTAAQTLLVPLIINQVAYFASDILADITAASAAYLTSQVTAAAGITAQSVLDQQSNQQQNYNAVAASAAAEGLSGPAAVAYIAAAATVKNAVGDLSDYTLSTATRRAALISRDSSAASTAPEAASVAFEISTIPVTNIIFPDTNQDVNDVFAFRKPFLSKLNKKATLAIYSESPNSTDISDYNIFTLETFWLQSISEADTEKYQIIETFSSPMIYFFNRRARVYNYSFVLENTRNNPWKDRFKYAYDLLLRGTACVVNNTKVVITFENNTRRGYVLAAQFNESSDNDNMATVSISMFVENETQQNDPDITAVATELLLESDELTTAQASAVKANLDDTDIGLAILTGSSNNLSVGTSNLTKTITSGGSNPILQSDAFTIKPVFFQKDTLTPLPTTDPQAQSSNGITEFQVKYTISSTDNPNDQVLFGDLSQALSLATTSSTGVAQQNAAGTTYSTGGAAGQQYALILQPALIPSSITTLMSQLGSATLRVQMSFSGVGATAKNNLQLNGMVILSGITVTLNPEGSPEGLTGGIQSPSLVSSSDYLFNATMDLTSATATTTSLNSRTFTATAQVTQQNGSTNTNIPFSSDVFVNSIQFNQNNITATNSTQPSQDIANCVLTIQPSAGSDPTIAVFTLNCVINYNGNIPLVVGNPMIYKLVGYSFAGNLIDFNITVIPPKSAGTSTLISARDMTGLDPSFYTGSFISTTGAPGALLIRRCLLQFSSPPDVNFLAANLSVTITAGTTSAPVMYAPPSGSTIAESVLNALANIQVTKNGTQTPQTCKIQFTIGGITLAQAGDVTGSEVAANSVVILMNNTVVPPMQYTAQLAALVISLSNITGSPSNNLNKISLTDQTFSGLTFVYNFAIVGTTQGTSVTETI